MDEQINQQSAEVIVLNVTLFELFQPVDNLRLFQMHYILFLILEFSFNDLLFSFQFDHALDQRFWGKSVFNSFGEVG